MYANDNHEQFNLIRWLLMDATEKNTLLYIAVPSFLSPETHAFVFNNKKFKLCFKNINPYQVLVYVYRMKEANTASTEFRFRLSAPPPLAAPRDTSSGVTLSPRTILVTGMHSCMCVYIYIYSLWRCVNWDALGFTGSGGCREI